MVLIVFRSRLREEDAADFQARANRMMEIAESMPGFLSYKVFASDDGERCTLIEFESLETLRAWREHPEHREAQRIGRERYYENYTLQIAEPERESRFSRSVGRQSA